MQVTIAHLPASLSLVHIPRSRLHQLAHPVLKQILQPNPTFLNVTCNEVELSLFADESVLEDFEPIARRDRQRQRSRSNSGSGRKLSRGHDIDPVEISYEKWSVLQVDSHNDQIDNSGARVHEVSAPLAAAGISILYQSSYMSDFIFVKESRLHEVMSLLAAAGFDLYSSGTDALPVNPTDSGDRSSIHDFRSTTELASDTVYTRARSGTDPESVSPDSKPVWREFQGSSGMTKLFETNPSPRRKSYSPTTGEVRLLPSDLACVGLSDELGADHWGLKIVKLVAFPELISPPSSARTSNTSSSTRPFLPSRNPSTPIFEFSPEVNPMVRRQSFSSTASSSSGEDDGYLSHSPQSNTYAPMIASASLSYSDLHDLSTSPPPFKPPSVHLIQPRSSALPPKTPNGSGPTVQDAHAPQVPFFSYTRTAEGSSLTADVHILSTLFPPNERHMVICSGELDAADNRLINGQALDQPSEEDGESDSEDAMYSEGSVMRCLQIDLKRFGLDKYGLVNRFSQVLEENGINHMYSSTFKTANLLVDKRHALRAQRLLCSC
ncbi:hypothetical protein Hypma_012787 [Hypsizygus marmoreus]|uniref:CASTOR ACT domain-containing protein n=1 Tax=Hypsizygus marmoreus TaxID=39966 RepID=A0A369JHC8_HYPMA|nr:hypothetical protein Hypma_012787 [Hypsizygus marmoreus]